MEIPKREREGDGEAEAEVGRSVEQSICLPICLWFCLSLRRHYVMHTQRERMYSGEGIQCKRRGSGCPLEVEVTDPTIASGLVCAFFSAAACSLLSLVPRAEPIDSCQGFGRYHPFICLPTPHSNPLHCKSMCVCVCILNAFGFPFSLMRPLNESPVCNPAWISQWTCS